MVSSNKVKKIAVFCASRIGNNEKFTQEGEKLGKHIANNGMVLIYGSSNDGLMGVISKSALNSNGKVIAVNTKIFNYCIQHEHENFEYIEYETIEQRQRAMIDMADAYVIFVGGFGTLFEYYHVVNLILIGQMPKKPIIIVNVAGIFDNVLATNEKMVADNLATKLDCEYVVSSADEVIAALEKGIKKCQNYQK